jgi:hypothetical protein
MGTFAHRKMRICAHLQVCRGAVLWESGKYPDKKEVRPLELKLCISGSPARDYRAVGGEEKRSTGMYRPIHQAQ